MPELASRRTAARTVAVATAGACAVGLVVVWVLAVHTGAGRAHDNAMLHGFIGLARERVYSQISDYALVVDPVPYAVLGLLCIGAALVRRRTARAVAVAVVLVGTGLTVQALKHLLHDHRNVDWLGFNQIGGLTWPSGHGTAAMTIALCAVIVAPPAWRGAVALLGSAFAVSLAYATLALIWHYPSDLFGGFLVSGLWVSLALAVVARFEPDPDPEPLPPLDWVVVVGAGAALLAAVLVGVASDLVRLGASDRATVVIGAFLLAALALALSVATAAASRG